MSELSKKLDELGAPADLVKATGMGWLAHESTSSELLFYRLPSDDQAAVESFKERVKNADYKWLFTNSQKNLGTKNTSDCGDAFYEIRSLFADLIYPLKNKKLIAITGTNGKTTTVEMIRQLLIKKNVGVLTIGTLGVYLNAVKQNDFSLTSPDYIDLRKALYEFRDGYQVCALEASSHAVHQKRLYGLHFDALGWTSFSQDHLDYHKTMDAYFSAKLALAGEGEKFVTSPKAKELNKKLGKKASPTKEISLSRPPSFLKSAFNQINLEVAAGCLESLGLAPALSEIETLLPPPGRFNVLEVRGRTFVIDFAHTPDALANIGEELRRSFPEKKLVTVFGCGGDRDRSKRELMGKAASVFSDVVVLTSDNPRTEDPQKIIDDIEKGVSVPYEREPDRALAIRAAFDKFKDALILVAGKGHEPYIDIGGEKIPYSDEKTIRGLK